MVTLTHELESRSFIHFILLLTNICVHYTDVDGVMRDSRHKIFVLLKVIGRDEVGRICLYDLNLYISAMEAIDCKFSDYQNTI